MTNRVVIELPPELKTELKMLSVEQNIPMKDIVSNLVVNYLEKIRQNKEKNN